MAKVTMREKLISAIIEYAGDEYETKEDVVKLAVMDESALIDALIDVLNYYYEQNNS